MKKYLFVILLFAVFGANTGFSQSKKIALHYSELTEILDNNLLDKLTYWEFFLIHNKISYNVIYDKDLESAITAKEYSLIIFPSTLALSEKAFDVLSKFIFNGGSVIAFGEFITYNEKRISAGWERFESFFGVRFSDRIPKNKLSVNLDLVNYSPLSNSINKLKNLSINAKNSPVIIEALANNSRSIAEFNFNQKFFVESETAAILKAEGRSYKIWFSFGPTEIIGGKEELKAFEHYILNTLSMIRGDDVIWIESFENSKQPVVMMFDLSKNLSQTSKILKIVDEQNLNSGFIISENETASENIKSLSDKGEIIVSLSSESLKLISTNLQEDNIISDRLNFFSKIAGQRITSIFVKGVFPDPKIIGLLKSNGIRNLFTSSYTTSSGENEGLNIIHISDINDLTLKKDTRSNENLPLQQYALYKLNRLRLIDKIPVLVYIADAVCEENEIQYFENFLGFINQNRISFFPMNDFLKWSDIKMGLKKSIIRVDNKTIHIVLTNKSNFDTGAIKLRFKSAIFGRDALGSIIIPGQNPDYFFDSDTGIVEVILDSIGRNRTVKIDAKVK